ncbi:ATP-binding cassette domain-containing protein [Burkholderia gladioli]|uniref:ATP-binding cassette domain-containing protein n=1 Tax=Burkholderia gladioli TaxID=28095 RepID=UPI000BEF47E8|nr:ATP-binding cassette domain-containing protein [Burkholderia gladioli]PEH83124.1 ABC transporter ATP-binding protein [Burkholderia gladioli]
MTGAGNLAGGVSGGGGLASRARMAGALWQSIRQDPRRVLLALTLLLAAKLAAILVPWLLKEVVDALGDTRDARVTVPVLLLFGYALVRFAANAFNELRDMAFAPVSLRLVSDLTLRSFAHLHGLGARYHAARETGATIRDIERGTAGVGYLLGVAVFTIVPTVIEIAAVVGIVVGRYGRAFALIVMLTFAAYATCTVLMTRRRTRIQRRVNALDANSSARVVDSLLNQETVKVAGRQRFEAARLATVLGQWREAGVDNQAALSALHIGQSAIIACGIAATMLFAGEQVVRGAMTVGDLVLINAYIIQISLPLNALGFVFREASDALTNVDRLFALLHARGLPGEEDDIHGARPLVVTGGALSFERVEFGYEPGRRILSGVSLAIRAGETVAVVGGSGSGKSTLARLLLRLYRPDAGVVRIDGQDLRLVTVDSLRAALGIVPQDTILFNDTIAYNIGYAKEGATRAEVVAAARAAQLDAFVERLPDGYDTPVGERGAMLSGGERQRIAIARVLLKAPPIVVFDEATSALDTRTERAIQQEMMRVAAGRTCLIIAHRLSTIVDADRIVVLDQGRLVEEGTHEVLLARGGVYAQMWAMQARQRDLARIESRIARHPVDLAALAASLLADLRAAAEALPPAERAQPPRASGMSTEGLVVNTDPAALRRFLWDVCQAGIDAGGALSLSVERRARDASVAVSCSAPDTVELSLLSLEAQQATLEADGGYVVRERDDSGVTIRVALPLHALSEPAEAGPALAAHDDAALRTGTARGTGPAPLEGVAIACVDDHEAAREALAEALQGAGARVHGFAGGADLLAWLRQTPRQAWPGILLCDIELEGEDGHAVLARVQRLDAGHAAPKRAVEAIALSGHADDATRQRAIAAGFHGYLTKPVDPRRLVEVLGAVATRTGDPHAD